VAVGLAGLRRGKVWGYLGVVLDLIPQRDVWPGEWALPLGAEIEGAVLHICLFHRMDPNRAPSIPPGC
jgi:hypothetical protein